MKKLITFLLLFISITLIIISPDHAEDNSIIWTEEEINFMEKNSVIRLGVDPNFVPFEFIDKDDVYKGITADYLSLISKKTGLEFEVVKGITWPEAYTMALSSSVDVLPAISKTENRELHFLFSQPYYYFKRVFIFPYKIELYFIIPY